MTRPLKFRAFNGAGMIYNNTDFKFYVRDGYAWYHNQDEEVMEVKDWPVMQFTGLTDKNGKEIYDADLIRHNGGMISIVEWDETNAAFVAVDATDQERQMLLAELIEKTKVEVIGNIHSNPELLK